ncbi:MAG: hypothetical protein AAGH60_06350 [Pseudomonadota bacterium]
MRIHFFPTIRLIKPAGVLAVCGILAGCGGGIERVGAIFDRESSSAPAVTSVGANTIAGVPVEQLAADQLCPSITVRDGTETLRVYASGEQRTPQAVRYQAQILQTAVECTPAPEQLGLTLGIAGRAILGPLGQPARIDLPVRVAIIERQTGTVLASEVLRTGAIIEPTEVSAPFTIVNRSFIIPRPERQAQYVIIVGFDELEV